MFNVHVFDQKLNARREAEKKEIQDLLIRQKKISERGTLTANYARRVDQFMITMANDPIQLSQHIGPMAVVPRDSNPAKYKGAARMILKTVFSRSMNASRIEDPPAKPVNLRARDPLTRQPSKSRVYLKRGAGIARIQKVGRKARLSILEPGAKLPLAEVSITNPVLDSVNTSDRSVSIDEQPKPKQVFAALYKKTHFKGVMSRLVEKSTTSVSKDTDDFDDNGPTFHRSRTASILWRHSKVLKRVFLKEDESSVLAKEILEACKVIPRNLNNMYLKRGDGRLTSNPQMPLSVIYKRLHDSRSESYVL